jgi:predicted esterase
MMSVGPFGAEHCGTVVFLHGFSMEASDLVEELERVCVACPGWRAVMPQAPRRRITAHGGEVSASWYDYLTDRDGLREDVAELSSLRETRVSLRRLVQKEAHRLGDKGRVVLAGLSQGGCVALDLATREPVGAVLTVVAHRLCVSRRPLLADWHCICAADDKVMPLMAWAAPRGEVSRHVVPGDHFIDSEIWVPWLERRLEDLEGFWAMRQRTHADGS